MKTLTHHLLILYFLTCLTGCSSNRDKDKEVELIAGGKTYGGKVRFVSDEAISNLFPLGAEDKYSMRISSQIFEGLLKMDGTTLEVVPAIAEKFVVNAEGDVYTFKIRKGVVFHKDECFKGGTREVTPQDVKFVLDYACSGSDLVIPDFNFINAIRGGKEYFYAKEKPVSGVEGIVIRGDKIEVHLTQPIVGFENTFTKSNLKLFPKEALDFYGKDIVHHPVGTGPFALSEWTESKVLLNRNPSYWKKDLEGNRLPYLEQLEMLLMRDKKAEILAFRNKEIDLFFEVTVDEIDHLLGTLQEAKEGKNIKHRIESAAVLGVEYIGFNTSVSPFNNRFVREAFAQSIDYDQLIDGFLNGDGVVPENGFVPYLPDYENRCLLPSKNLMLARDLLRKAGYNSTKPFPVIDLYFTGEHGGKNYKIAECLKKQLKDALGVTINLKIVTYQERIEAIANNTAKMWKAGWISETGNPIEFLSNFSSNGYSKNDFGYTNAIFDYYYTEAIGELDGFKRREWIRKAQDEIVKDAVVIPLIYDNMIVMYNVRLRGLTASQFDMIDFTEVFIKDPRD